MNGAGAATTINTYDEYGQRGAANAGRFQFTGQTWLPEVALYHYRARAYSPSLGRFLQTDPILHAGGMNLYAYVGNDPLNATDPWGLECQRRTGSRLCKSDQQIADWDTLNGWRTRTPRLSGASLAFPIEDDVNDDIVVIGFPGTRREFRQILRYLEIIGRTYGPAYDVAAMLGSVREVGGVFGELDGQLTSSRVYTGAETGYPTGGIDLGNVARAARVAMPGFAVRYDWHFHVSAGIRNVAWEGFSSRDLRTTGRRNISGSFLVTPSSIWYVSREDAARGYRGHRVRRW